MSNSSQERSFDQPRSGSHHSSPGTSSGRGDSYENYSGKLLSKGASFNRKRGRGSGHRLSRGGGVVKSKHMINNKQRNSSRDRDPQETTSGTLKLNPLMNEPVPTDFKVAIYDQRESGVKHISEKESDILLSKLHEILIEESENDEIDILPTFYYAIAEDGFFFVNCVNESSMNWLKSIVTHDLQNLWPGACLKLAKMAKIADRWFVVIGLHDDVNVPSKQVMRLLSKQNPWCDVKEWILLNRGPGKNGKVNFIFSMSHEDREELTKRKHKVFYKMSRLIVNFLRFVYRRTIGNEEENRPGNGENPEKDEEMDDVFYDEAFMDDGNWEVVDQE